MGSSFSRPIDNHKKRETFVSISSTSSKKASPSVPSLLPKFLQTFPESYVSHTSSTFQHGENDYSLTSYTIDVPHVWARSDWARSQVKKAKLESGVVKFGEGPTSKLNKSFVYFQKFDEIERSLFFGLGFQYDPPSLGCALQVNGLQFKIDDKRLEQSWDTFPGAQIHSHPFRLDLRNKLPQNVLKHPRRTSDIIWAGDDLSRVFDLELRIEHSQVLLLDPSSRVELCISSVSIYELVTLLDDSNTAKPRVLCDWSQSHIFQKSGGGIWIKGTSLLSGPVRLPSSLIYCRFPELGPTFYSEKLNRSYYLVFTLKIKYLLSLLDVVLRKPVVVAQSTPGEFIRSLHLYDLIFLNGKGLRDRCTHETMERAPFNFVKKYKKTYKGHEIETVATQKSIYFITKVYFTEPGYDKLKPLIDVRRDSTESEEKHPENLLENCKIECRVLEERALTEGDLSSCKLFMGLVFECEAMNAPINIPLHHLQHISIRTLRSMTHPSKKSNFPSDIRLNLTPIQPLETYSSNALCILLPGASLWKFVHLLLRFNLANAQEDCPPLVIRALCIELEERHNATLNVKTFYKLEGIYDYDTTKASRIPRNSETYQLGLSDKLCDINIPSLEPTTLSDGIIRYHWLRVAMLLSSGSDDELLDLRSMFPVLVAKDEGGLHQAALDAPPSYDSAIQQR